MTEIEMEKVQNIIKKCQRYSGICHTCKFYKRCFFGFECLSNNYSCYKGVENR